MGNLKIQTGVSISVSFPSLLAADPVSFLVLVDFSSFHY